MGYSTFSMRRIRLLVATIVGDAAIYSMKAGRTALEKTHDMSYAESNPDGRFFLIGCPNYGNLGDHAIALAERKLIHQRSGIDPISLCGSLREHWNTVKHTIRKGDVLLLQGGGNMGTLYESFENERLAIVDRFTDNRIILFPQTFSYGETPYERAFVRHMARVYEKHPDIHLVARERMSYERMRKVFHNVNVLLTPDIVLSLPAFEPSQTRERMGFFLCMRADKERVVGDRAAKAIGGAAQARFHEVLSTDTMHPNNFLSPEEGEAAVWDKIAELSRAQLVVTDRIHGMIFCALSGTPCIALDNSNGKVGQEYEWLKGLPYMHFAHNAEEAAVMIRDVDLTPGRFPAEEFAPLFDPIAELLPGGRHGQV